MPCTDETLREKHKYIGSWIPIIIIQTMARFMALKSDYVHMKCGVELSPEGRLNIKMQSYHYRDHHVKDKTVSRPSYL